MLQADGVSLEDTTVTNFDYDFALSPRVWLEYRSATGIGLRTQFWQFDQAANTESAAPPANGFGQVTPPEFGNVDISSNIPSDRFTASSGLKTYYVDVEALDLLTPFHTSYRSSQDDILPIGELQLGGEWYSPQRSWGQWFARGAFEAQLWNGVGSASSPTGNLGFVGFSAGLGFAR